MFVWKVALHSFLFVSSRLLSLNISVVFSKRWDHNAPMLWFESTRDEREVLLRALGWERRESHQCDDGPPSTKFHLVKRSVIIVKDLPLGVFAFTAALVRWGQKRCTLTHGSNCPVKPDICCEVEAVIFLSHTHTMKKKTFKRRNASKPHLPVKHMMFCWSLRVQAKTIS